MLGAGILMRVPFLLAPWIDSAWYVIAAAVNYTLSYRAGVPAWMGIGRETVDLDFLLIRMKAKKETLEKICKEIAAVSVDDGLTLSFASIESLSLPKKCSKINCTKLSNMRVCDWKLRGKRALIYG